MCNKVYKEEQFQNDWRKATTLYTDPQDFATHCHFGDVMHK